MIAASRYVREVLVADLELSRRARSVLLALSSFANRDGDAWPSRTTLARITGYDPRSVTRALGELELAGVIARRDRSGSSTVWRFPVASTLSAVIPTLDTRVHPERVNPGHRCPPTLDTGARDPGHPCPPEEERTEKEEARASSSSCELGRYRPCSSSCPVCHGVRDAAV